MPIYEYRCNGCGRKVAIYLRSFESVPKCPQCGSEELSRLFSTFALRKTHQDIYEDILTDGQLTAGMMRNDPQALAEWNRRMTMGMEDDHSSPEYDEALERMERGEIPDFSAIDNPFSDED